MKQSVLYKRLSLTLLLVGIICVAASAFLSTSIMANAANTDTISLFGIHDPDGADRTSWMQSVQDMYNPFSGAQISCTPASVSITEYFGASDLLTSLKNSDYLYIHTHGLTEDTGLFKLKCISTSRTSWLSDSIVFDQSVNAFSSLKVCFVGACNSYPMAEALRNRGAVCAIGYQDTVSTTQNRYVISCFNLFFCSGNYSAAESLSRALAACYSNYGTYGATDSAICYGTSTVKYS